MQKPLVLVTGGGAGSVTLPNRLVKAALSEALADPLTHAPNDRHFTLYQRWAEGQPALLVTGNVMVDSRYCESPRNVVLEDDRHLALFERWAKGVHAASQGHTRLLAQLSHPGRQCPLSVTGLSSAHCPVAPSTKRLRMSAPGLSLLFRPPRALSADEIPGIVQRYVNAAVLAERAGLDGVQVHSAHGYLVSQFLSAHTNTRTDAWGGTPEKRRRFLLEILRGIRAAVKRTDFIVCVKLNSTDFQPGRETGRGGGVDVSEATATATGDSKSNASAENDSVGVIRALAAERLVDFIELSGGTYEDMTAMVNAPTPTADAPAAGAGASAKSESTRKREAFFLEFAEQIRREVRGVPLMVTGGWRTAAAMNAAINDSGDGAKSGGADLIGLGRPFCIEPLLARDLLNGTALVTPNAQLSLGLPSKLERQLVPGVNNLWHVHQLRRLSDGQAADLRHNPWCGLLAAPAHYVVDPQCHPRTFRGLALAWALLVLFVLVSRIRARYGL